MKVDPGFVFLSVNNFDAGDDNFPITPDPSGGGGNQGGGDDVWPPVSNVTVDSHGKVTIN